VVLLALKPLVALSPYHALHLYGAPHASPRGFDPLGIQPSGDLPERSSTGTLQLFDG
jgi:hypothetical protein